MNLLKIILHAFKHPVETELKALKDNRDVNIATIESLISAGSTSAVVAVETFLASTVKKNPTLALVYGLFSGQINAALAGLAAQGINTVPALYDGIVAFLAKEESYL